MITKRFFYSYFFQFENFKNIVFFSVEFLSFIFSITFLSSLIELEYYNLVDVEMMLES